MAIFKKTKKEVTALNKLPKKAADMSAKSAEADAASKAGQGIKRDFSAVLVSPRITEKASLMIEKDTAYVFNVHQDATKHTVAKAVFDIYNVTPVKVRMAKVPSKNVFSRGRAGVKKGGKKAIVYLKKGEKISIM